VDEFNDELKRAFGGPKDLTALVNIFIELECGLTVQGQIDKASAKSLIRDPEDINKTLDTIRGGQDCVVVLPRSPMLRHEVRRRDQ